MNVRTTSCVVLPNNGASSKSVSIPEKAAVREYGVDVPYDDNITDLLFDQKPSPNIDTVVLLLTFVYKFFILVINGRPYILNDSLCDPILYILK